MKQVEIISKIVGRGESEGITSAIPSINLSGFALKSDLLTLEKKFSDFLNVPIIDGTINRWNELETFLAGISEDYNLLSLLNGKADKSYVDTNFVTIATKQTITGEKNFTGGLKVNGSPIYYDSTNKYWKLEGDLLVTGGVTMYGTDEGDLPSILDSLPIASNTALGIASFDSTYFSVDSNGMVSLTSAPSSGASSLGELLNVDASIDATASVDRVLYQPAGSAMWTWRELPKDGVVGNYLPLSGGTLNGALNIFRPNISNTNTYTFWIDNYGFYLSVSNGDIPLLVTNDSVHIGYSDSFLTNLVVHGNVRATKVSSKGASWGQYLNSEGALYGCTNITSSGIQPILGWSSSIGGFSSKFVIGSYTDGPSYGGMYLAVINSSNPSTGRRLILHPEGNLLWEGYISGDSIRASHEGYYFNSFQFARFNDYGNLVLKSNNANMFFRPNDESESGQMTIDTSGNMLVSGGITMYSDKRKKTVLNHVELSLKQIADAPLIEHYYNSDQEKTTHVGSIAQYWAGLNDWFCKLDAEGFYTMEIQNCALASAISIARHLEKYETKTDKTIRKMKQRIQELEDEVERLKQN